MHSMLIGELRDSATFQKLTTQSHRRFLYVKSALQMDWIRRSLLGITPYQKRRCYEWWDSIRQMFWPESQHLEILEVGDHQSWMLQGKRRYLSFFRSVAEIKKRPTGLNSSQSCLRRLSRLQNEEMLRMQDPNFHLRHWECKKRVWIWVRELLS